MHRDAAGDAIDQQREIQFAGDVAAGLDIDAVHRAAGGTGLFGDQRVTDHRLGMRADLVQRAGEAHPALAVRVIGEMAGAAAAGVQLRLHDVDRAGQLACCLNRLVGRPGNVAVGHRDAVALQQFLGLVFMDVHGWLRTAAPHHRHGGRRLAIHDFAGLHTRKAWMAGPRPIRRGMLRPP